MQSFNNLKLITIYNELSLLKGTGEEWWMRKDGSYLVFNNGMLTTLSSKFAGSEEKTI